MARPQAGPAWHCSRHGNGPDLWGMSAVSSGGKASWTHGHLCHRLGLSVTRSSKGLCEGRRRLLASILLHRWPNGGLVLWHWDEGRCQKRKLGPTQRQTKTLVEFIKKKKRQIPASFSLLQSALTWFSPARRFPWSLLCSGNFCCKQSKWPFELNWNLQRTLLVLDQAQKKKVRAGQNVLGKFLLGVHLCLIVANSL